jgi:hypothetical protein
MTERPLPCAPAQSYGYQGFSHEALSNLQLAQYFVRVLDREYVNQSDVATCYLHNGLSCVCVDDRKSDGRRCPDDIAAGFCHWAEAVLLVSDHEWDGYLDLSVCRNRLFVCLVSWDDVARWVRLSPSPTRVMVAGDCTERAAMERAGVGFYAPAPCVHPDPPATTAYDHVRQNFQPVAQDTDPTAEPRTYGTLSLGQMVIKHGREGLPT